MLYLVDRLHIPRMLYLVPSAHLILGRSSAHGNHLCSVTRTVFYSRDRHLLATAASAGASPVRSEPGIQPQTSQTRETTHTFHHQTQHHDPLYPSSSSFSLPSRPRLTRIVAKPLTPGPGHPLTHRPPPTSCSLHPAPCSIVSPSSCM
jgi:hypothetical protein